MKNPHIILGYGLLSTTSEQSVYCDFLKFLMQEMAETSYLPTAQKFLERLNCFQCAVFILLYYDNLILGYFYAQKCLTLKLMDYLR